MRPRASPGRAVGPAQPFGVVERVCPGPSSAPGGLPAFKPSLAREGRNKSLRKASPARPCRSDPGLGTAGGGGKCLWLAQLGEIKPGPSRASYGAGPSTAQGTSRSGPGCGGSCLHSLPAFPACSLSGRLQRWVCCGPGSLVGQEMMGTQGQLPPPPRTRACKPACMTVPQASSPAAWAAEEAPVPEELGHGRSLGGPGAPSPGLAPSASLADKQRAEPRRRVLFFFKFFIPKIHPQETKYFPSEAGIFPPPTSSLPSLW